MKKLKNILALALLVVLATSCADTVDISACTTNPVGFWYGFWHGFISPIAFFISLFNDDVAVYAVYNSGGWYDFGFLIGAGALFGGGGKSV